MFKKLVLLAAFAAMVLGSGLQAMQEQGDKKFRVEVKDCYPDRHICLYIEHDLVGFIYHTAKIDEREGCCWVSGFKIADPHQKKGLSKLLMAYVVADILSNFPKIKKIRWASRSGSYMSNVELAGFYKKLGGVLEGADPDGRCDFEFDIDILRKQKTFLDFKKISNFIRSEGTVSLPKEDGVEKVLLFYIESDGQVTLQLPLRSRL